MKFQSEQKKLLLILAIYVPSRAFHLFLGFGLDVDAWSIAFSAKRIAEDWGYYEASRLPGYPIPEHIFAFAFKIFGFGFLQANLVAFIFGILSTIGLWHLARELKLKPFAPTLAFAFHPVIWISSVETMDYIFGVCFMIWAIYFYIKNKPLLSGAFVGLACGSRITLLITSVAFTLDMLRTRKIVGCPRAFYRYIVEWLIALGATFTLSFSPVILTYGLDFFTYSRTKINIFASLHRLLHEFFGVPFVIGLMVFFAIEKIFRRRKVARAPRLSDKRFLLWMLFIAVFIPYLSFPLDAFYLASAIGVGILLLAFYFSERAFNMLAVLIISSSLISPLTVDKHEYRVNKRIKIKVVEAGPSLNNALERAFLHRRSLKFIGQLENFPEKSVYVMGNLFFYISWNILGVERWENVPFVHRHKLFLPIVPKEFLQKFKSLGWQILYDEEVYVNYQTERAFGYSLKELGAKPLDL